MKALRFARKIRKRYVFSQAFQRSLGTVRSEVIFHLRYTFYVSTDIVNDWGKRVSSASGIRGALRSGEGLKRAFADRTGSSAIDRLDNSDPSASCKSILLKTCPLEFFVRVELRISVTSGEVV